VRGITIGVVLYVVLIVAGCVGWGLNIYKLTQCDFEPSYKAEIIRGVGVVTPIGAIVGYMDIGK